MNTPIQSTIPLCIRPGRPGCLTPFGSTPVGFLYDAPGNLHDGAGTIAFADAYVEAHQWRGRLRRMVVSIGGFPNLAVPASAPDISWLSYHSQRKGPESY